MKFKEGMRIKCKLNGLIITDAKLHKEVFEDEERWFICQNIAKGAICKDQLGYLYSYVLPSYVEGPDDFKNSSILRDIERLSELKDRIKSILEQI